MTSPSSSSCRRQGKREGRGRGCPGSTVLGHWRLWRDRTSPEETHQCQGSRGPASCLCHPRVGRYGDPAGTRASIHPHQRCSKCPGRSWEEELLGCFLVCAEGTLSLQSSGCFIQPVASTDLLQELHHQLPLKWQVLSDIQMCKLTTQAYALPPHPPETKLLGHLSYKSSHQARAGFKGTSEGSWRSCKIAKVSSVALGLYSEDTAISGA